VSVAGPHDGSRLGGAGPLPVHPLHLWGRVLGHDPSCHGGLERDRLLVGILSGVLLFYLLGQALMRDRAR
jgi:hypothetical protein